jgi:S1-C subfamily serine protease
VEDVHAQLAADAIGKTVAVQLLRGGVAQEAKIVIAERARGGE